MIARALARRRVDLLVGAALFVGVVAVLLVTEKQVGFTRDEGYYFKAAEQYWGWFRDLWSFLGRGDVLAAFDKSVIDRHWSYNHEHPVLMKTLFALSWGLGKEWLGLFELHSTAFRFPTFLMAGLSVALVYAMSRALRLPRAAALLAAGMWISMPRVFWQMHLACFDIAVCAAHLWLVLAYLKGRRTALGAVVVGLAFGLAASVKHNVLVAPAFFVLHWLLVEARGFARTRAGISLPALPLAFFSMAILGPIVFVLHWPYLWPDILMRVGWYLGFHLNHEHYPILWFGELLEHPPFPVSFPFVMSAITIPVPVLVVMVTGAILGALAAIRVLMWRLLGGPGPAPEVTRVPLTVCARPDPAGEGTGSSVVEPTGSVTLLLLLNAAFPFALIALPSSPIFGGTKHWMNALPFLCVLGAWAVTEGLTRAQRFLEDHPLAVRWGSPPAPAMVALVAVLVVMPGFWLSARVHPYGLGQYNSVVGFARGAANVGFQRTFWGYEPRLVLPLINEGVDGRGRIAFGDTNRDDYNMYRRDGLLRSDLAYTGSVGSADVISVQPQGEFKDEWLKTLDAHRTGGPDHVVHIEGVPLLTVTFAP